MSRQRKDITGNRYGRLLVLKMEEPDANSCSMFLCLCDCGCYKVVKGTSLSRNVTKSCGCITKDRLVCQNKANSTHNLTKHTLFTIMNGMLDRCYNKKSDRYKYYGLKGVSVYDEWVLDFKCFYNWCIENGWEKGLNIDRFPNKNGNYEPSNCRFVTSKVNGNNKNNNVYATINGIKHTPSEWSDITGVNQQSIRNRISTYGLDGIKAVYGKKYKNYINEQS